MAGMLSTMAISWKHAERDTFFHKTIFGPFLRMMSCIAKITPSTENGSHMPKSNLADS